MKKISLTFLPLFAGLLSGCVLPEIPTDNSEEKEEEDPTPQEEKDPTPVQPEEPEIFDWKYTIDFSKFDYEDQEEIPTNTTLNFSETIALNFLAVGSSNSKTKYNENDKGIRFYKNCTFSINSSDTKLEKIDFEFSHQNLEIYSDVGTLSEGSWTGSENNVTFSFENKSGNTSIKTVTVHFSSNEKQPEEQTHVDDEITDLGTMTIGEIKAYVAQNPITCNSFSCGVDYKKKVTVNGLVVGRVDLLNTTKSFGLDVSFPAKTIVADSTGIIGCASGTGQGTLYYKTKDYVNKDTTRYSVTGYLSVYLGNVELEVISYVWDQNMTISYTKDSLPSSETNIDGFYEKATNVNYNCAGNGYGEVVTLKNLTCFNYESGGSGIGFYNFTDGEKNIRVNSYNCGSISVGSTYNIKGYISLKNYSPIIVATQITNSTQNPTPLDYEKYATNITIENLRKNARPIDNTSDKMPAYISSWKNIYKTTGYLTSCYESGNYYIGIRDIFYSNELEIEGKGQARTTYKMALIENPNFWKCSWEEIGLFNPLGEYINVDSPITVYYIQRQEDKFNKSSAWNILLINDSLPTLGK